MSYQVLARKYRPANFEELQGQQHVLRALMNALDNNRLHHAYLFTGTRGVGKTTIARILAKCLNCETGISATPCGTCGSCLEIAEGRNVDLIEYDAASRTKVEDTREILDNVQYLPSRCRFKVYLIDEVHMLSNHSFNALLKTLEEPPEHVKFLLATTDPKKLPITVLSRCLQFNLKNISPEGIVKYLQKILPVEGIKFDDAALWQLGRAADGSMRDALSLTDQAISFGNNSVNDADVKSMLGSIDQFEVYALLNCLIDNDAAALLAKISALAEFAPDYSALLAELLSVLHRIAVTQAVPASMDNSQGDQALVTAAATALSREDVQLFYQIGLIGQRDLPFSPDLRTGFEMVLLRMLAFTPFDAETPGDAAESKKKIISGPAKVNITDRQPDQNQRDKMSIGTDETATKPPNNPPQQSKVADLLASLKKSALNKTAKNPPATMPSTNPETTPRSNPLVNINSASVEEPSAALNKEPSAALNKEPSAALNKEPSAALNKEPSAALNKEPSAALNTEPSAVLNKEPSAVLNKEPSAALNKEPSAALNKEPSAALNKQPSATAVQEPARKPSVDLTIPKPNSALPDVTHSVGQQEAGADPAELVKFEHFKPERWSQILPRLELVGVTLSLASHCVLIAINDNCCQFQLSEKHNALWNTSHQAKIATALGIFFNRELHLECSIGICATQTPAEIVMAEKARDLAAAVEVIENDDKVQQLISRFEAKVEKSSIRPNSIRPKQRIGE